MKKLTGIKEAVEKVTNYLNWNKNSSKKLSVYYDAKKLVQENYPELSSVEVMAEAMKGLK
jgi:hypothetical protein